MTRETTVLSLLEAKPEELRAIAHFLDTDEIDSLLENHIVPVVEAGGGSPDRLIGYERCEGVIYDGDTPVGWLAS